MPADVSNHFASVKELGSKKEAEYNALFTRYEVRPPMAQPFCRRARLADRDNVPVRTTLGNTRDRTNVSISPLSLRVPPAYPPRQLTALLDTALLLTFAPHTACDQAKYPELAKELKRRMAGELPAGWKDSLPKFAPGVSRSDKHMLLGDLGSGNIAVCAAESDQGGGIFMRRNLVMRRNQF